MLTNETVLLPIFLISNHPSTAVFWKKNQDSHSLGAEYMRICNLKVCSGEVIKSCNYNNVVMPSHKIFC